MSRRSLPFIMGSCGSVFEISDFDILRSSQHGYGSQYWLEDTPQDCGRAEWQRGNRYKGEFVKGKRQGLGRFWYSNGAVYEGEFEDNKKHGWGVYIDDGGHPTEGLFVEDVSPLHSQQLHSPQKKQT